MKTKKIKIPVSPDLKKMARQASGGALSQAIQFKKQSNIKRTM
jgi:hypothetical protein